MGRNVYKNYDDLVAENKLLKDAVVALLETCVVEIENFEQSSIFDNAAKLIDSEGLNEES